MRASIDSISPLRNFFTLRVLQQFTFSVKGVSVSGKSEFVRTMDRMKEQLKYAHWKKCRCETVIETEYKRGKGLVEMERIGDDPFVLEMMGKELSMEMEGECKVEHVVIDHNPYQGLMGHFRLTRKPKAAVEV